MGSIERLLRHIKPTLVNYTISFAVAQGLSTFTNRARLVRGSAACLLLDYLIAAAHLSILCTDILTAADPQVMST